MMTREHRQEALSLAYVQAIAAHAGVTLARPGHDYGIDLTLREVGEAHGQYLDTGIALDVQLKSTTVATREPDGVTFDLDARAYDLLRADAAGSPRVLVLLALPADEADWLSQTADELVLRHAAYWLSLRGQPASRNRRSVRVRIPGENLFTAVELGRIMALVRTRRGLT